MGLCIYKTAKIQIIDGVICLNETVMLKIAKKGEKGYQVSSVPLQKLKRLANDKHRFWSLEGDFLVLKSYSEK
jgi:hypothetical protein